MARFKRCQQPIIFDYITKYKTVVTINNNLYLQPNSSSRVYKLLPNDTTYKNGDKVYDYFDIEYCYGNQNN